MPGEARAPRVRVAVDGSVLDGVMSAEVASNNHLAADRWRVRLATLEGVPEALDGVGARVAVSVALGGEYVPLVVGEADSVRLDPLRGVVDVEGRDLSALLIDARLDETFANRTASEIAATLAGRHGLMAEVDRTETPVGRYYQSEHDRVVTGQFSKAISEWDLLGFLAVREGFDLFMDGAVLRFGRSGGAAVALPVAGCIGVELEHALGMTRAIEVTVRSWDQRGGQAVVQTARGGGRGRAWRHAVVKPNLPPDEAARVAERMLADLVRHEWTASVVMPGELSLSARSTVALSGTGSAWDRTYRVGEISRHVDARHGFTQRMRLVGVA